MIKVPIMTKQPYDVVITTGELSSVGEYVARVKKPCRAVIVSDKNVAPLYLETVEKSLAEKGFSVSHYVMRAGEQNKTPETYLNVVESFAKACLTRSDLAVALGGGVVGDICGFAAATYMRGIDFVQIPTSLLSAIDASVGGKTAVDLPEGKNLLGAFHQPILVFADTDTLKSLPVAEVKNGLGEGLKYAVLCGGELMNVLERGLDNRAFENGDLARFIALSVEAKGKIVATDETENGERRLLNLGHTLGHAIEKESSFKTPHGVAVAEGVIAVAKASAKSGKLKTNELNKILDLAKKYGLSEKSYKIADLISSIKMDKKMDGDGTINFVDINSISNCSILKLTLDELKTYLSI